MNNGMGSSGINWAGDSKVPTKYAHLPASEARARIAKEEAEAKLKQEEILKQRIAELEEAKKDAFPETPNETKTVVETVSVEEGIKSNNKLFSDTELAKISNIIFTLSSKASITITSINKDGVKATLDGIPINISKA